MYGRHVDAIVIYTRRRACVDRGRIIRSLYFMIPNTGLSYSLLVLFGEGGGQEGRRGDATPIDLGRRSTLGARVRVHAGIIKLLTITLLTITRAAVITGRE